MNREVGKKTAAIYARVSTLDQSCESQLEDLRRYASQRFGRCYEFVDEGVSGTQRRRPQLDALMNSAHKRLFDAVLVWKFDRFARSVKHLVDSLAEFRALGLTSFPTPRVSIPRHPRANCCFTSWVRSHSLSETSSRNECGQGSRMPER